MKHVHVTLPLNLKTQFILLHLLENLYRIDTRKFLSRGKSIDPILVLVLPFISCTVATTIPRLKADEWSHLSRRRPYSHNRSIKVHAQPWSSVCTEKSSLAYLRILKHYGIYSIKCITCQWKFTVSRDLKRVLCLQIYAAFLLDPDTLQTFSAVKDKVAALLLLLVVVRIYECRMGTDLEVQVL